MREWRKSAMDADARTPIHCDRARTHGVQARAHHCNRRPLTGCLDLRGLSELLRERRWRRSFGRCGRHRRPGRRRGHRRPTAARAARPHTCDGPLPPTPWSANPLVPIQDACTLAGHQVVIAATDNEVELEAFTGGLPFPMCFYGELVEKLWVGDNGYVGLDTEAPNALLAQIGNPAPLDTAGRTGARGHAVLGGAPARAARRVRRGRRAGSVFASSGSPGRRVVLTRGCRATRARSPSLRSRSGSKRRRIRFSSATPRCRATRGRSTNEPRGKAPP